MEVSWKYVGLALGNGILSTLVAYALYRYSRRRG